MSTKYSPCPKCREIGNDNSGDNLVSFNDGGSHCFSCGFHIFPRHFVPRGVINEIKANRPNDFTREVPNNALKWLLKWGLPWSHWKETIGYSPSTERLIFLLPTFSIGRYVGDDKGVRKWKVWGEAHTTSVVLPGKDNSNSVVLVEDLVSAHKVSYAGYLAIPLFGTKVYPCHIKWLAENVKSATLWLDKDQEGTIMRKAAHLQSIIGIPINTIITEKDPKCYSLNELVTLLGK